MPTAHVLHPLLPYRLHSGPFRLPPRRTTRRSQSFFPLACELFNADLTRRPPLYNKVCLNYLLLYKYMYFLSVKVHLWLVTNFQLCTIFINFVKYFYYNSEFYMYIISIEILHYNRPVDKENKLMIISCKLNGNFNAVFEKITHCKSMFITVSLFRDWDIEYLSISVIVNWSITFSWKGLLTFLLLDLQIKSLRYLCYQIAGLRQNLKSKFEKKYQIWNKSIIFA